MKPFDNEMRHRRHRAFSQAQRDRPQYLPEFSQMQWKILLPAEAQRPAKLLQSSGDPRQTSLVSFLQPLFGSCDFELDARERPPVHTLWPTSECGFRAVITQTQLCEQRSQLPVRTVHVIFTTNLVGEVVGPSRRKLDAAGRKIELQTQPAAGRTDKVPAQPAKGCIDRLERNLLCCRCEGRCLAPPDLQSQDSSAA